jgi:hypothetical protein
MNTENLEIPEYEIEGLIQTLKEMGIKGLMKWSDVLVYNHLLERQFLPENRQEQINILKNQTDMSYGQIMELLQRYDKWKEILPSYSLRLNQIMNSINKRYNSVVPFRYIGNGPNRKLLGFVEEGENINIYDGTGKHLMLVCSVDKKKWGIHWNDYVKLTTPQQKYITDEVKRLKENHWL